MMVMMMIRKVDNYFVQAQLQYATPSMYKLKGKLKPESYLIIFLDLISMLIRSNLLIRMLLTTAVQFSILIMLKFF